MKNKKRILIMMIILVIITGCGKKNDNKNNNNNSNEISGPIVNVEEGVTKDKELGNGIVAKNTRIVTNNGETTIISKIINSGENEVYIKYIDIIFKDENDEEIKKLIGYVGTTIPSKGNYDVITSINVDLSKTKSIEYKINY